MKYLTLFIFVAMSISCIKDQAIDLCADQEVYCGLPGQPFCQIVKSDSNVTFQVSLDDKTGTNLMPATEGGFDATDIGTNTSVSANQLVDALANFTGLGLRNQFLVKNQSTGDLTWGTVNSATTIDLNDDIFTSTPEAYQILNWWGVRQPFTSPFQVNCEWDNTTATGRLRFLDSIGSKTLLYSDDIFPNTNSAYRVVFTISDYTSGELTTQQGVVPTQTFSGNGLKEGAVVNFAGLQLQMESSIGSDFYIQDVEVYEIPRIGFKILNTSGDTLYTYEDVFDHITYLGSTAQISINFNSIGLPDGCYLIRVYDLDTPNEYLESRCLSVQTNPQCALKLEWTNTENVGGITYNTSVGFTQTAWVDGEMRNSTYDLPNTLYRYSNGDSLILNSKRETIKQLRLKEIPEHLHRAIASGTILDTFKVNDVQYRLNGESYEPIWRTTSRLAPSITEFKLKEEDYENNLC